MGSRCVGVAVCSARRFWGLRNVGVAECKGFIMLGLQSEGVVEVVGRSMWAPHAATLRGLRRVEFNARGGRRQGPEVDRLRCHHSRHSGVQGKDGILYTFHIEASFSPNWWKSSILFIAFNKRQSNQSMKKSLEQGNNSSTINIRPGIRKDLSN